MTMTMTENATVRALSEMYSGLTFEEDVIQNCAKWGYFTLSTGKWLADRLDYDPVTTACLRAWVEAETGLEHVSVTHGDAVQFVEDFLGVPASEIRGDNSYNHDNYLEDTIQWVEYPHPATGETVILLQIHLGGDVRGNYSDVVAFRYDGECFGHDIDRAEMLCGYSGEDGQHYFEVTPWGVEDHEGAHYEMTTREVEGAGEAYVCPKCLTAGRLTPVTFRLPCTY